MDSYAPVFEFTGIPEKTVQIFFLVFYGVYKPFHGKRRENNSDVVTTFLKIFQDLKISLAGARTPGKWMRYYQQPHVFSTGERLISDSMAL